MISRRHILEAILLPALAVAGLAAAAAQDESKAPAKQPPKTIDVRVRVSTKGGEPVPAGSQVEISGKEDACGILATQDATGHIRNGEVTFTVAVCRVAIKTRVDGYIQDRKDVDLRQYQPPIALLVEKER